MSTTVWESNDGEKLKMGTYEFKFSFLLPQEIPPSFESSNGNIRYYINVVLDRPWIWNKTIKKSFTVVPIVNLASVPNATHPIVIEAARKTGLIFKSGVLELKASIRKRGYVSGEIVPVQIQINNQSKKPVTKLSVKICQDIKCLARRGTRSHIYEGKNMQENSKRKY